MKISRIFSMILIAAAAVSVASCSDDDEPQVVVEQADPANVHEAEATYNSLTFAWDKVQGVNQYGYTLADADGVVVADGITDATTISFGDLRTDAAYTFELRVYGEYGKPSYYTTISGATLPIRQLATPQPTAKQQGNQVVVSWPAVEGAGSYRVTYTIGENVVSVETDATTYNVIGLAPGKHQVAVEALSNYGGYTDSEAADVQAVRTRTEVGTVNGTYTSGLIRRNNSWAATMHIYDDGSYVIEKFYQGEGYNLDVYVATDPETGEAYLGLYNFETFPDCEYYTILTGRASVPTIEMIPGLVDGAYGSSFQGDATSGTITINTRYSTASGTDKFVW